MKAQTMTNTTPAAQHQSSLVADRATVPASHSVSQVAHDGRALKLHWDDGRVSRFEGMWLRDNCDCPSCRHPQAMERIYMFIDHEPPRITQVAQTTPDVLEVHFSQGSEQHVSRFGTAWLRQHCHSSAARNEAKTTRTLWDAGLNGSVPTVDFGAYMHTEEGLRAWITAIRSHGIVLLQGVPQEAGKLLDVARRIGPVRQTNFGDHYDVISMPNPNAVAYTALGLELHNDLVNWRFPPDVQMLSCLKSSVTGGESLFADGFRVAEDLRARNPKAFALLSQQLVEFRFHDANCDIRSTAPMLTLDPGGQLTRVRFNNWLRSSLQVSEDLVAPMYEAIAALWALLRDTRYHLNLKLRPGELIAYDNNRILHGRKSFDPNSGERHLQGCYMNMEDLDSAMRMSERRTALSRC
jgi:gamma-butyrobetaine dioxygenase